MLLSLPVMVASVLLSQITFGANFKDNPGVNFSALIEHLKKRTDEVSEVKLNTKGNVYNVLINSLQLKDKIKGYYTAAELADLSELLNTVLTIQVNGNGTVIAADRQKDKDGDPTHYDAVWVRDSLWSYLGLNCSKSREQDARKVLTNLLSYFSSPDQLSRFRHIIAAPSLVNGPGARMDVVHVRFDPGSEDFKDVTINGIPQPWNHKQNDALGLFWDLILRAIYDGEIRNEDLAPENYQVLAYFPAYFTAIKFYEMEDAGSWEEIERLNTSSIGLVVSALERFRLLTTSKSKQHQLFIKKLRETAAKAGLNHYLDGKNINLLIDSGYKRIFSQLHKGGESPSYDVASPKYRTSDAALLNLIYPAKLQRLQKKDKLRILELLKPLVGRIGIKRYIGDSYQSGNFWFNQFETVVSDEEVADGKTKSAQEFGEREKQFTANTEAEWFFDSWYSKALGLMYKEYGDLEFHKDQVQFFNRSLGQITNGARTDRALGADGKPVMPNALPESYNTIFFGIARYYAPSPITPLNWAKATLALALDEMKLARH